MATRMVQVAAPIVTFQAFLGKDFREMARNEVRILRDRYMLFARVFSAATVRTRQHETDPQDHPSASGDPTVRESFAATARMIALSRKPMNAQEPPQQVAQAANRVEWVCR